MVANRDRREWPVSPVPRDRRELGLATHDATEPKLAHQPGDGATCDPDAFAVQLRPHLVDAVDAKVVPVHPCDLGLQHGITDRPYRERPCFRGVVGTRGELQHTADRLDPEPTPVLVDVNDHLLVPPSSSVAKKSDADFKISFACRSSRFSRSSSFNRARSSLDPGRRPSSTRPAHPDPQRLRRTTDLRSDRNDRSPLRRDTRAGARTPAAPPAHEPPTNTSAVYLT